MDKEWYQIRDLLFGRNEQEQNIDVAIHSAHQCTHPDAVLICSALKGKLLQSRKEVIKAFAEYGKQDTRSLCFAWCLMTETKQNVKVHMLKKAAENGYAFAETELYRWLYLRDMETEAYAYLEHAVQQNERDAFRHMVQKYVNESATEKAMIEAKKAANLGHVQSMVFIGHKLQNISDQLFWFGQAAVHGDSFHLVVKMDNDEIWWPQVIASPCLLYQVGYYAKQSSLCNFSYVMSNFDDFYRQKWSVATQFYNRQNIACQLAVETWSLCALRLKLYKDIRILIAKIIWDSRSKALFDIP